MLKSLFSIAILAASGLAFAQKTYWQQEVNFKINVRLDDKTHTLHAFESFEYINNSPNSLDKIYIHLWPNAYRDGKTALAKQIYEQSNKDVLHYGKLEDRGGIDSLDFKINGATAKWEYHPKHDDIAILYLSQPLASGQKITVSTPFKVKIPSGKISRLGHIEESYQITQWYPKPAVYDHKGWHPMPYVTQGEFYSEFGSFDVTIQLPKNYVVGATGDLQTASELAFLDSLAQLSPLDQNSGVDPKSMNRNAFPESSTEFKTIRYIQSNVHDFAWFADKRYRVLKGEVELPNSKRKVTTWAMYVPQSETLWLNALEYLHDATYYYSLWNGDYPYNQVTAVDGTISAGGGMEYPNVTVIGSASNATELELVIVHEVGHNWFYGILGTNERVHGWMDEGLNTLNEMRYFMTKYPENTAMNDMIPFINAINFEELSHHDMGDIMFRATQRFGADQPIETHSCAYHPANYGTVMYQKTGLIFHYLKAYLGEKVFDECMQTYFETWKFKHPYPEDLKAIFEQKTGKDLSWFFGDLINNTNYLDYKLVKAKTNDKGSVAVVKNKGQVNGPIEVNVIKNNQVVETQWIEPGTGRQRIDLVTTNADEIVINNNKHIPELYRNNNRWHQKGLLGKMEPVKFEFLIGDNEPNKTNIFWTPVVAGNIHDKLMLGVAVHNNALPMNRFQYLVAPMFSFGRRNVSGIAEFNYAFHPKSVFRISRFGLSAKSFKMYEFDFPGTNRNDGSFYALTPYWSADLGKKGDAKAMSYNILVMGVMNFVQLYDLDLSHSGIMGQFTADYKKRDYQFSTKLRAELVDNGNISTGRIQLESTHTYRYLRNKLSRAFELRLFGGVITNSSAMLPNEFRFASNGTNGFQDLFFENYYLGRGATSGMFTNQRDDNQGSFKTGVGILSDSWMATANLYAPLPVKRLGWIGAFADFGAFGTPSGTEMAVNLGLGVRLGSVFGIYFPLYSTDNLMPVNGNYGERIRFTLKMNPMHKVNLRKLIN